MDDAGLLERLVGLLETMKVSYCVIGGQGVNAYVDPLVSLDLDVVIAAADLDRVLSALPPSAQIERFRHSVNVAMPGSGLRLQFQVDPRYLDFPARAASRPVLGLTMRVAAVEDLLMGKYGPRWIPMAARANGKRISPISPDWSNAIPSCERYCRRQFSTRWFDPIPPSTSSRCGSILPKRPPSRIECSAASSFARSPPWPALCL